MSFSAGRMLAPKLAYSARNSAGRMGPLQLAVTLYKIRHAGEQAVRWDIQNTATSSRQICIFFVLDVPVRSLLSSMADFVPCDRQLQKAHLSKPTRGIPACSPNIPPAICRRASENSMFVFARQ